jgi:hypothetical protein
VTATVMFNGSLYNGTVVRETPKRLLVTFTTGTGTTRTSWFAKTAKPAGTLVGRRTSGVRRFGRVHRAPVLPADAVTLPANSAFIEDNPARAAALEAMANIGGSWMSPVVIKKETV